MCITPLALLGPYRAAPGPKTTSMRSISSLVTGMKLYAFSRSEGTRAMRLSVNVSKVPENTLLKPRTTTLRCTSPVWAISTPGSPSTCSATDSTGLETISLAVTTATDAGASSTFSFRRDTEETDSTPLTKITFSARITSKRTVCPGRTTTLATCGSYPINVTVTWYSPAGRSAMRYDPSALLAVPRGWDNAALANSKLALASTSPSSPPTVPSSTPVSWAKPSATQSKAANPIAIHRIIDSPISDCKDTPGSSLV